jgi:hypothetical protein
LDEPPKSTFLKKMADQECPETFGGQLLILVRVGIAELQRSKRQKTVVKQGLLRSGSFSKREDVA